MLDLEIAMLTSVWASQNRTLQFLEYPHEALT